MKTRRKEEEEEDDNNVVSVGLIKRTRYRHYLAGRGTGPQIRLRRGDPYLSNSTRLIGFPSTAIHRHTFIISRRVLDALHLLGTFDAASSLAIHIA